ncbi:MAG: hypothetical protein ACRYG8_24525 [Janthinobacterium lividum]
MTNTSRPRVDFRAQFSGPVEDVPHFLVAKFGKTFTALHSSAAEVARFEALFRAVALNSLKKTPVSDQNRRNCRDWFAENLDYRPLPIVPHAGSRSVGKMQLVASPFAQRRVCRHSQKHLDRVQIEAKWNAWPIIQVGSRHDMDAMLAVFSDVIEQYPSSRKPVLQAIKTSAV